MYKHFQFLKPVRAKRGSQAGALFKHEALALSFNRAQCVRRRHRGRIALEGRSELLDFVLRVLIMLLHTTVIVVGNGKHGAVPPHAQAGVFGKIVPRFAGIKVGRFACRSKLGERLSLAKEEPEKDGFSGNDGTALQPVPRAGGNRGRLQRAGQINRRG